MKRLFEPETSQDEKRMGCGYQNCHVRPQNFLSNKLGVAIYAMERDRKVLVDGRLWHAVCWLSARQEDERAEGAAP